MSFWHNDLTIDRKRQRDLYQYQITKCKAEEAERERQCKLELCDELIASGLLLPEADEFDEEKLLAAARRYRVIESLVFSWSKEQLQALVLQPPNQLIPSLRKHWSGLSAGA